MKAAVITGKRSLTYVKGILQRYKAEGVDEPWNVTRNPKSNHHSSSSRSGKPNIPIVEEKKQTVSKEELAELRKLAQKIDSQREPEPIS